MHVTRKHRLATLHQLADEGRWNEVYRQHIFYEFPQEARLGFQLAFMRPFCDPEMAEILVSAGRITSDAQHRGYATAITLSEIIAEGPQGPRGRRMVAHMNRQHRQFPITPEQMTYVLSAFVVAPTRYIERVGWRPVDDVERTAAARFYDELGQHMAIKTRHSSYEHACDIFDAYEAKHLRPTADTRLLGEQTMSFLSTRLPWPISRMAGQLFSSQIGDDVVAQAVGLPPASPLALHMGSAMVKARGAVLSRRSAPRLPTFAAGQPAGPYRTGYSLSDIER